MTLEQNHVRVWTTEISLQLLQILYIKEVKAVKVDGERIKVDTFYKLIDGEFVEQK